MESERVHIRRSRFPQFQLPKVLKAEIEKQARDLHLVRAHVARAEYVPPTLEVFLMDLNGSLQKQLSIARDAPRTLPVIAQWFVYEGEMPFHCQPEPQFYILTDAQVFTEPLGFGQ